MSSTDHSSPNVSLAFRLTTRPTLYGRTVQHPAKSVTIQPIMLKPLRTDASDRLHCKASQG